MQWPTENFSWCGTQGMNCVSFGQDSYTDLDFTDNVSLLAELFIPVLQTMANEATSLGFKELTEDKGPSFGHLGECAIDRHSSGPTGHGS